MTSHTNWVINEKEMNVLKKILVWVCWFRKRKGYGVHSPSAFYFIRSVVLETELYYAYADLKPQRKGVEGLDEKVDKLLFRLANYVQPSTVVQVSGDYPLSLAYLQTGCQKAQCFSLNEEDPGQLASVLDGRPLDLFHLPDVPNCQQWFLSAVEHAVEHSLFVVQGIHKDKQKKELWKEMQEHPRVGRTYDLYEVGLIFFDHSKVKQHYKVNFV